MSFLPLFPVIPNNEDILERLEYLTSIIESWEGTEQRIGTRDNPFKFTEFGFSLLRYDKVLLEAALFANVDDNHKQFTIPTWQDLQILGTAAASGQAVVVVSTGSMDFEAAGLNNLVVLISGLRYYNRDRGIVWYEYEIREILTVNAENIILTDNLADTWAVGSLVIPAREGWLIDVVRMSDLNDNADVFSGRARFKLEAV